MIFGQRQYKNLYYVVYIPNNINKHGKKANLTLFEGVEHNCWDRVYLDDNTYKLLED